MINIGVKAVSYTHLMKGMLDPEYEEQVTGKLEIRQLFTSVIRMVPPLILTEEHCDKAAEIIREAVEELTA